ncbi:MAG: sporulation protein YqfD [Clostridia bacterium]|nr:sporulation protein YqfD [Clostridia bacterium]
MRRWMGYLRLRIVGLDIERQIRKILSLGVVLGNLKRDSATSCSFDIFPHELPRLRRAGIKYRTDLKGGLTVIAYSARRRIGLALGVVAVAAALILLQGRVMFIDVLGNSGVTGEEILSLMDAPSLLYKRVDGITMEKLEQDMLEDERLQWVSITQKGVRLTVTVKEKPLLPSEDYKTPGDIVASKVGVISEVTVLQGEAVAEKGKLVLPGEVLIKGELAYAGAEPERVAAMGKCMARVWYSLEREISLTREKRTDTGEVFITSGIRIFDGEFGMEMPEFEDFRIEERIEPVSRIGVPIYRVERRYIRQQVITYSVTAEQGLEECREELENEMKQTAPDAELSFYCQETENGAIVGISAVREEDIGVFKSSE